MFKAACHQHILQFAFDAGTSRGVLKDHPIWLLKLWHADNPNIYGLGECAPLRGLSLDDRSDLGDRIQAFCQTINNGSYQTIQELLTLFPTKEFPSLVFGLETAWMDLNLGGKRKIFDTTFSRGMQSLSINGLIWMGDPEFMRKQIKEKLSQGYRCLKLKVGALDFDLECQLLEEIRELYPVEKISLRLDANGAWAPEEAQRKLQELSRFHLHSIEQPIKAGQPEAMEALCRESPVSIALDEELIGYQGLSAKRKLLQSLQPAYLVLKPTLLGGFTSCREWIQEAEALNIGWWLTSALESNVGLNAISQFASTFSLTTPQGLGTGQLYLNNFTSPLTLQNAHLSYDQAKIWDLPKFS